jgi:hypothetical protein
MIKAIEFPGRSFATKAELFRELKANETKLIGLKKSAVYKSHEKGQFTFLNAEKLFGSAKAGFNAKEGYIYPIISTTKYMDSHMDVHFDGCFGKTAKEQQGKVYYALDHELKWDSILAWQKDVNMFISNIDWSLVGKSYSGNTEALVFEIQKNKLTRKDVLDAIEAKASDFENSIRMIYHKIVLGMNSDEKDHAESKAYYESKINQIANKEIAEEAGYFWGVEELAIYKEGSLVIAGGSNDATSIYSKEIEPPAGTQDEPLKSTLEAAAKKAEQDKKNLLINLI